MLAALELVRLGNGVAAVTAFALSAWSYAVSYRIAPDRYRWQTHTVQGLALAGLAYYAILNLYGAASDVGQQTFTPYARLVFPLVILAPAVVRAAVLAPVARAANELARRDTNDPA